MSELMPPFHFDDYTLRIAMPEDLPLATAWSAADPDHATTIPWFWVRQSADINSLLLEDAQHRPIFFFRMQVMNEGRDIEVHIQFSPDDGLAERERVMNALLVGFAWLEKRLASAGFKTLYFHSRRPGLIRFCEKRMGFAWDGRRLERKVTYGEVKREEEKRTA
jgi:hypothetical protein